MPIFLYISYVLREFHLVKHTVKATKKNPNIGETFMKIQCIPIVSNNSANYPHLFKNLFEK